MREARPAPVSESLCPAEPFSVETRDGQRAIGVRRSPPGSGPFPLVVLLHGGLDPLAQNVLELLALRGWTMNRLLAAGYALALPTRRALPDDPARPGALWDTLAVVAHLKALPEIDSRSVVLLGSSGGADLALELAGQIELAALAAEEPATGLFTGILNRDTPKSGDALTPADAWPSDFERHYTAERQRATREKIARIACPLFVSQGDQPLEGADPLAMLNRILIPELVAAGKPLEQVVYAGQSHGFGFVAGAAPGPVSETTAAAAGQFFADVDAFFQRHLPTRPVPIAATTERRGP